MSNLKTMILSLGSPFGTAQKRISSIKHSEQLLRPPVVYLSPPLRVTGAVSDIPLPEERVVLRHRPRCTASTRPSYSPHDHPPARLDDSAWGREGEGVQIAEETNLRSDRWTPGRFEPLASWRIHTPMGRVWFRSKPLRFGGEGPNPCN